MDEFFLTICQELYQNEYVRIVNEVVEQDRNNLTMIYERSQQGYYKSSKEFKEDLTQFVANAVAVHQNQSKQSGVFNEISDKAIQIVQEKVEGVFVDPRYASLFKKTQIELEMEKAKKFNLREHWEAESFVARYNRQKRENINSAF